MKKFTLQLTEEAREWLESNNDFIVALDFQGWVTGINGLRDIKIATTPDSDFLLFSLNKKFLTDRERIKAFKKFVKERFLEWKLPSPFPEYETTTLKINKDKIRYYPGKLFL